MKGILFKKGENMKKRILNKRGKFALTILTILASAIIYVLMAVLGEKAQDNIFYQLILFCGYTWLFLGQMGIYFIIWGGEVNF